MFEQVAKRLEEADDDRTRQRGRFPSGRAYSTCSSAAGPTRQAPSKWRAKSRWIYGWTADRVVRVEDCVDSHVVLETQHDRGDRHPFYFYSPGSSRMFCRYVLSCLR
jgi:hypothetical protein